MDWLGFGGVSMLLAGSRPGNDPRTRVPSVMKTVPGI